MKEQSDNELIALFMGWKQDGFGKGWTHPDRNLPYWPSEFVYDKSWDWLMPVCNKLGIEYICTDITKAYAQVLEQIKRMDSGDRV